METSQAKDVKPCLCREPRKSQLSQTPDHLGLWIPYHSQSREQENWDVCPALKGGDSTQSTAPEREPCASPSGAAKPLLGDKATPRGVCWIFLNS